MATARSLTVGEAEEVPLCQEVVGTGCRAWYLIKNRFAYLKDFRGVSIYYCMREERYEALVCLAAWYVDTR